MASESMLVEDSRPATEEPSDKHQQEEEDDDGSKKEKEYEEEEEESRKKESEKSEWESSKRPPRERKLVERYSIPSLGKTPPSKPLSIPKGSGSQLKDIPNVAFKLSKRRLDENLQLLHTILFGKKAKAHSLKRNIGQFSGFVWTENEEKQRSKVKDKLDKCTKEKLVDFCDVLNIPINKATVRKEELSAKLLVFLESPYATTDVLLSEKDQKSQKKRKHTTGKSPISGEATETPAKKQQTTKDGKKQRLSTDTGNDKDMVAHPEGTPDDSGDGNDQMVSVEESDHAGNRPREGEDSPKDKMPKDKSGEKEKKVTARNEGGDIKPVKKAALEKPVKSSSKSSKKSSKESAADADASLGTPVKLKGSSSMKKAKKAIRKEEGVTAKAKKEIKEEGVTADGKAKGKKKSVKSPEKLVGKGQGKGKTGKKAKAEPTKEEMHVVIVNILKQVDFNTATLSDIIKLLGGHFGVELLHRKGEVKEIITDVINNMSDDEEDAEENTGTDAENDE